MNDPLALLRGGGIVTAVDIGTTKLCCMVAELALPAPRVLAVAHRRAEGLLERGTIGDLAAFRAALASVVEEAEAAAGEAGAEIYLAFSGGAPDACLKQGPVPMEPGRVRPHVLTRALEQAERLGAARLRDCPGRELLHVVPVSYLVDGRPVAEPSDMHADSFAVAANVVTTERGARRNLDAAADVFGERLVHVLAAPWASALAVLDRDEREVGALAIDLGGACTTMAWMEGGLLRHLCTLPFGGKDITRDIAARLKITLESAERLKTRHGHALDAGPEDRALLQAVPLGAGEGAIVEVPRSAVVERIRFSLARLFAGIAEEAASLPAFADLHARATAATAAPAAPDAPATAAPATAPAAAHAPAPLGESGAVGHVVLTGGGAEIQGVDFFAEAFLGRRPRLAAPQRLHGLPALQAGPAYAAAVGALLWAAEQESAAAGVRGAAERTSPLAAAALRSQRWLRRRLALEF